MIFCKMVISLSSPASPHHALCRAVASQELDEAEAGKSTGITILSFISVVTLIFYFFVKNALGVIRVNKKYSIL